ncbi:rhamnulokinase [Paenibacillus mendelii]|uniref:Rhamnulokinase family protein n=1 Tax=Paenibacillus mendelii TaxID=206163 RepID=A0ABV6J209_9BACL|nr:rhamnulokinase family protein [Paenibacillus mendelii]MCQ6562840.1 rhamnulokinase [Paenibacillus mendelii]
MESSRTVLAFDLGASSGRALLGRLSPSGEAGSLRLQVEEIHRFPNGPVTAGGRMHWNILSILQEIKTGIRLAYESGEIPESFGIDTWGVDFGLLDANGELLGNPYHYRDSQTEGVVEELGRLIGEEKLYSDSGLQFMPFNTLYQLYAMKKAGSPKLAAARTLLMMPDLLLYYLTGRRHSEYTLATTTMLFHPVRKQWNGPLLERIGVLDSLFMQPVQPGASLGELTDSVRQELGVPPLKAVAVGSHDTASAVAAVPSGMGQFVYLVCGTWSLLGTVRDEPLLGNEAMRQGFSNEGGVDGGYRLLKNIMGLWLVQECHRKWNRSGSGPSFADLTKMADESVPFHSLIAPDLLRFMNPPDMEAEIAAFCRETGQPVPRSPGETIRCILESLALRYRQVLRQTEALTGTIFPRLHMVGGGIRNETLGRFTANAIQIPVWAGPEEASAIGNLLVQFQACGAIQSAAERTEVVAGSFPLQVFQPEVSERSAWDQAYEIFCRLGNSGLC